MSKKIPFNVDVEINLEEIDDQDLLEEVAERNLISDELSSRPNVVDINILPPELQEEIFRYLNAPKADKAAWGQVDDLGIPVKGMPTTRPTKGEKLMARQILTIFATVLICTGLVFLAAGIIAVASLNLNGVYAFFIAGVNLTVGYQALKLAKQQPSKQ